MSYRGFPRVDQSPPTISSGKGENRMPALNRVQLIGRLSQDPENRYKPTGKYVARFSLAVSNRWKSGKGESKESTEWVNIEA
jgi:single-strand DNA-binding protein